METVNKLHKMLSTFIGLIFFTVIFTQVCSGNISVHPLEISIPMNEEFIWGNSSKKITIGNNGDQSVNVSWYLEHPNPISWIRPNKTCIPTLSWIDLDPKWRVVQPDDSLSFYIYLDIPESEEQLGQHWETWVTFKQELSGGMFNQEHAVRVYIDTPGEAAISDIVGNQIRFSLLDIVITAVIAIILIILGILVYKKKKL